MRIKLLLNRAVAEAYKLIAQSHRWQKTAIAAAAAAFFGLSSVEAWSLSLGRITVQSALGEPLRAEIDVPEISSEEASSLTTSVGRPDAFSKAGLEYNAIMASLEITLQRRANGRAYLRLSSDRPVNDPFVDMIIEASWSSGRILRDYTLLFDPPTLRKPATTAPTLPQITATAPPLPTAPPVSTAPTRPVVASTPPAPADGMKRVVVKEGDTASKIANAVRPAGVSLDQMLVALLRANPEAFIRNDINRIRSGAVLHVPGTENANTQPQQASEANQVVVAKSKDFGAFRRSLAANAPVAEVGSATRKAGGSIDARVEDRKTPTAPPDKLTLSKGAIQGKTNDDKIAKERVEKEAAARAAEISKNISDLEKVAAASAPASGALKPGSAPAIPAIPVAPVAPASPSAPATPVASAPVATPASAPVSEPVSAPASAPASTPSAPEAAASTAVNTPVPARVEIEQQGLMEELLDNPWLPVGAGGLLAVLAGLVFWGIRWRKKKASAHDSSYLESRLQPESFFGTSGGQQIDTNNENPVTGGSSMVFLASQMDGGADDVDPVAEADVYLAYGRDVQAEEILKEAVRTNPGRLAVHTKLLEIYYKRRDARSFETSATQAYRLTGGTGADWNRVCDMGLVLDPDNPLYQPGGKPGDSASSSTMGDSSNFNSTIAMPAMARVDAPAAPAGTSNLDLDLDFSIDDEPASVSGDLRANPVTPVSPAPQVAASQAMPTVAIPAAQQDDAHSMDLDFDVSGAIPLAPASEETPQTPTPDASGGLDFSTDDLPSLDIPSAPSAVPKAAAPAEAEGMLEFDLGSLSLDLDTPPQGEASAQVADADSDGEDPLATKLALAEEFISIGDEDGARALVEEVVAEASGEMRTKAQGILARLR